jgi:predicted glycosyltransferase
MSRTDIEAFLIFQYSNGFGHLARCSTIAEAFGAISHVTMFSGGRPIEGYIAPSGIDLVQLPAIRWDAVDGALPVPVNPEYTMAEIDLMRSTLLVDSYVRIKPRLVIIEYFPFAPRRFGNTTLDGLFDAINREPRRPAVICSIRAYPRLWDADVDPAWINKQLRENFSLVLHHADSKLFPLNSLGPYIQTALSGISAWQTGFIRRPLTRTHYDCPSNGLLLTVGGGGEFGGKLLKRWIKAARAGPPDFFPVNAVCGRLMDDSDRKSIHAERDAYVRTHDWVENMDELIGSSRAIVCMGGYNTLVEALSLKKPVLAFPFREMGDQVFQINALHGQGMLLKGDLSLSEHEITALMNQLLNFRPQHLIDCNCAARSVEIVKQLLKPA